MFQDFGKRVSEAAKSMGQRTREATDIARLNGRVSAAQSEVERLFSQIGKAYYAVRPEGACEAAEILCQQVDKLNSELELLQRQIDQLRGQSRCPNCGGLQPAEASFCASCGTRLPRPAPVAPIIPVEEKPDEKPEKDVEMPATDAQIIWPEAPEATDEAETDADFVDAEDSDDVDGSGDSDHSDGE